MEKGRIVQVLGAVVDVEFENGKLPMIKDALTVQNGDKKVVMEVAQHMGNNIVRCIMLASSEGLTKDMEVVATGAGITIPVGPIHSVECLMYLEIPLIMAKKLKQKKNGEFIESLLHLKTRALL